MILWCEGEYYSLNTVMEIMWRYFTVSNRAEYFLNAGKLNRIIYLLQFMWQLEL